MKRNDFTPARKLALVAVIASYMCIATACAGSGSNENMYDNENMYNNENGYNNESRYNNGNTYNNESRYNNGSGYNTETRESTDDYVNSVTNGTDRYQNNKTADPAAQNPTVNNNNGSLLENAGDAANRTLNNVGDAANDLFDGAGNVINDATNAGTNRP